MTKGIQAATWQSAIEAVDALKDCPASTALSDRLHEIAQLLDLINHTKEAAQQLLIDTDTLRRVSTLLPLLAWLVCHNVARHCLEFTALSASVLGPILKALGEVVKVVNEAHLHMPSTIVRGSLYDGHGFACLNGVLATLLEHHAQLSLQDTVDNVEAVLAMLVRSCSQCEGLGKPMAAAPSPWTPPCELAHLFAANAQPQDTPMALTLLRCMDQFEHMQWACLEAAVERGKQKVDSLSSPHNSCALLVLMITHGPDALDLMVNHSEVLWQLLRPVRHEAHVTSTHWLGLKAKMEFVQQMLLRRPQLRDEAYRHDVFTLLEDWWYYLLCCQFRVNAPVKHLLAETQQDNCFEDCFRVVHDVLWLLVWELCKDHPVNMALLLNHGLCTRLMVSAQITLGANVSAVQVWQVQARRQDGNSGEQNRKKLMKLAQLGTALQVPAQSAIVSFCLGDFAQQLKELDLQGVQLENKDVEGNFNPTLRAILAGSTRECASIWKELSSLNNPVVSEDKLLAITNALSSITGQGGVSIDGVTIYHPLLCDPNLFQHATCPVLQSLLWLSCRNSNIQRSTTGQWVMTQCTSLLCTALVIPVPLATPVGLRVTAMHDAFLRNEGLATLHDVLNSLTVALSFYCWSPVWRKNVGTVAGDVMQLLGALDIRAYHIADVKRLSESMSFLERRVDQHVVPTSGMFFTNLAMFSIFVEVELFRSNTPCGFEEATVTAADLLLQVTSSSLPDIDVVIKSPAHLWEGGKGGVGIWRMLHPPGLEGVGDITSIAARQQDWHIGDGLWRIVVTKMKVCLQILTLLLPEERSLKDGLLLDIIVAWWHLLTRKGSESYPPPARQCRSMLAMMFQLLCQGNKHNTYTCLRNKALVSGLLDVVCKCLAGVARNVTSDIAKIKRTRSSGNAATRAVELVRAVGRRLACADARAAAVKYKEEGGGCEIQAFTNFYEQMEQYELQADAAMEGTVELEETLRVTGKKAGSTQQQRDATREGFAEGGQHVTKGTAGHVKKGRSKPKKRSKGGSGVFPPDAARSLDTARADEQEGGAALSSTTEAQAASTRTGDDRGGAEVDPGQAATITTEAARLLVNVGSGCIDEQAQVEPAQRTSVEDGDAELLSSVAGSSHTVEGAGVASSHHAATNDEVPQLFGSLGGDHMDQPANAEPAHLTTNNAEDEQLNAGCKDNGLPLSVPMSPSAYVPVGSNHICEESSSASHGVAIPVSSATCEEAVECEEDDSSGAMSSTCVAPNHSSTYPCSSSGGTLSVDHVTQPPDQNELLSTTPLGATVQPVLHERESERLLVQSLDQNELPSTTPLVTMVQPVLHVGRSHSEEDIEAAIPWLPNMAPSTSSLTSPLPSLQVANSSRAEDDISIAHLMATLCPSETPSASTVGNTVDAASTSLYADDVVAMGPWGSTTIGVSTSVHDNAVAETEPHDSTTWASSSGIGSLGSALGPSVAMDAKGVVVPGTVGASEEGSAGVQGDASSGRKTPRLHDDMYCPITQEIMTDPVIAMDGYTYERRAISAWFAAHDTSPMTNEVVQSKVLVPNRSMYSMIREAVDHHL